MEKKLLWCRPAISIISCSTPRKIVEKLRFPAAIGEFWENESTGTRLRTPHINRNYTLDDIVHVVIVISVFLEMLCLFLVILWLFHLFIWSCSFFLIIYVFVDVCLGLCVFGNCLSFNRSLTLGSTRLFPVGLLGDLSLPFRAADGSFRHDDENCQNIFLMFSVQNRFVCNMTSSVIFSMIYVFVLNKWNEPNHIWVIKQRPVGFLVAQLSTARDTVSFKSGQQLQHSYKPWETDGQHKQETRTKCCRSASTLQPMKPDLNNFVFSSIHCTGVNKQMGCY